MAALLRVNTPDVINETIDGESVMINLRTGTYYSLTGAGVDIWTCIEHVTSIEDIVERVTARYDATAEVVRPDVDALVQELSDEGLVVPCQTPRAELGQAPWDDATAIPYERPRLEKFTDMQDLILLDPVHEVDHRGWPHVSAVPLDAS